MSKLLGLLVNPDGTLEEIELDPDGGLLWGNEHDTKGIPSWVAGDDLFSTEKEAFIFVNEFSISPLGIGNHSTLETNDDMLSSIMAEQFQKKLYISSFADPLKSKLTFMIAVTILTLIVALIALGLFLPEILSNWFGGSDIEIPIE